MSALQQSEDLRTNEVQYLMAAALPGMYMMFPYIRVPVYVLSAINFMIPILVIFKDKKEQSKSKN